jgi:hypothetical protein
VLKEIGAETPVHGGAQGRPAFVLPDMWPQDDGIALPGNLDLVDVEPKFFRETNSLGISRLEHTSIARH